jgi:hypothetical protein
MISVAANKGKASLTRDALTRRETKMPAGEEHGLWDRSFEKMETLSSKKFCLTRQAILGSNANNITARFPICEHGRTD